MPSRITPPAWSWMYATRRRMYARMMISLSSASVMTSVRSASSWITSASQSATARPVALDARPASVPASPEKLPGPWVATTWLPSALARDTSTLPEMITNIGICRSPCWNNTVPAANRRRSP